MNAIIVEIGAAEVLLLMSGRASLQVPEGTRLTAIWMDVALVDGCEVRKLLLRLEHESFPEAAGFRIARVEFTPRKPVAPVPGVGVSWGGQLLAAGVR